MLKNTLPLFFMIWLLPSWIKSTENVYLDTRKVYNAKKLKKLSKQQHDQLKKQKKRIMIAVSVGIVVGIIILLIYIYRSRIASVPLPPNADDNTNLVPSYDYKNLQELDLIAYTNYLNDEIDLTLPNTISLQEATELSETWDAVPQYRITDIIFHKNGNSIAYVQGLRQLVIMDLMQDETTGNTHVKIVKKEDIIDDYAPNAHHNRALYLFSYDDQKLFFSDGHQLMQMTREGDKLITETICSFDLPATKTIKEAYETEKYIYGYYDEGSFYKNSFGNSEGIFRIRKDALTPHAIINPHDNSNPEDAICFNIYAQYPYWESTTAEKKRTNYFVKPHPDHPDYVLMVDLYHNKKEDSLVSLWNIRTRQRIDQKTGIQFCHIDDQCTNMITFDGADYTLSSIAYNEKEDKLTIEEKIKQTSLLQDSEYTYQSHTVTPDGHLLFVSSYSQDDGMAKVEVINTENLEIIKNFEHTLKEEEVNEFRKADIENGYRELPSYSPLQYIVNMGINPSSEYLFSFLVTQRNRHDSYIKIDKIDTFLHPTIQPYPNGEREYRLSSRLLPFGGWRPYHFLISPRGDFVLTDYDRRSFLFLNDTR